MVAMLTSLAGDFTRGGCANPRDRKACVMLMARLRVAEAWTVALRAR